MKIVSSAKVRYEIQDQLTNKFPSITFSFFTNIDEAKVDLCEAEVLITYGEDLTSDYINEAKKLKWIMVISAGLDEMPLEAIKQKGIFVTNARGIHTIPMAEYTLSMILQVSRQSRQLIRNQQDKQWDRRVKMTEIHGKTIGILGAGAIGSEIARLAKAFGMKVIGLNQSGKSVQHFDHIYKTEEKDHVLQLSDFIVSVLPSTRQTDNFITKRELLMMKREAVFINIGRGKTVNEKHLYEALKEDVIAHAVLDVFVEEPLPKNHPFWEMDNVTITPHISGITPQYQHRAFEIFDKNLEEYLKGGEAFINIINLEKGY